MNKIDIFGLGWITAIISAIFVGIAFGPSWGFSAFLAALGITFAVLGVMVWKEEERNKVVKYGQLLWLAASELMIASMAVWVVFDAETIFPLLAIMLLIVFSGLFLVGAMYRARESQEGAQR